MDGINRIRYVLLAIIVSTLCLYGKSVITNDQLQRAEDLENSIKATQPKSPDIFLDESNATQAPKLTKDTPCFLIKPENITLVDDSKLFTKTLKNTLQDLHYSASGECIGVGSINAILVSLQNAIIAQGYVTTRVLVEPQDLSTGVLHYNIILGRVDKIRFSDDRNQTSLINAMPLFSGDILNLRDIEQGLENLKRIPTGDASMQIVPAGKVGYSDVVITYTKRDPFRFSFSVDDAGYKSTGKVQGGATISVDNPLLLNDLFYYTYTKDIAGASDTTLNDEREHGLSTNKMFSYSIPFGYYMLGYTYSKYHYEQAVAGVSQISNYSGNASNQELYLTRGVYRDRDSKLLLTLKAWQRKSDNFIEDAKIPNQTRITGGYALGFDYKKYINSATLDLGLYYKRGTGAFGAIRAVEESKNEGTSRMEIYTLSALLNVPLSDVLAYSGSLLVQYNGTKLTPQDRLSIGGRYSVRGFSGEYTLSGDRGVVSRNELDYSYLPNHNIYVAIDGGHVDGPSTRELIGQSLVGGAIGTKGAFVKSGVLSYDLFVGLPLYYPKLFPKDNLVGGYQVIYSF